MDHEEMKKAYLKALELNQVEFDSFCNTCKTDYAVNSGEVIDVLTFDTKYKIWYCDDCTKKDLQFL